jgi:hypothetical protein
LLDNAISQMSALLTGLKGDIEAGMIVDLEARVSGETFDDLLDHAAAYLSEGRHEPAGVLAGVVFEDTIRRLSAKHGIDPAGKELDSLLNALKSRRKALLQRRFAPRPHTRTGASSMPSRQK